MKVPKYLNASVTTFIFALTNLHEHQCPCRVHEVEEGVKEYISETLQRYKNHGVQSEEKEIQTIATMVVDLAVNGLSNSTETNVWFDLYKNAVSHVHYQHRVMDCYDP